MYEQVISNSLKFIECDVKNKSLILDGLYFSSFFTGDFVNGEKYLNEKLKLNPDNFNPNYVKAVFLLQSKNYDQVLKYLDAASEAKDIDEEKIYNLNVLKCAYYLLIEDYKSLSKVWKINKQSHLNHKDVLSIKEVNNSNGLEFRVFFDKNSGSINTFLTIPAEVVRLIKKKYNLNLIDE